MSIEKFLKRKPAPVCVPKPNYVPFHTVTHRAIGDIPGCLPAQDVFVSVPIEVMQAETGKRAEEYCALVRSWNDGNIGHREFMNHPMHKTDVKIDILTRKAPKYKASWLAE